MGVCSPGLAGEDLAASGIEVHAVVAKARHPRIATRRVHIDEGFLRRFDAVSNESQRIR